MRYLDRLIGRCGDTDLGTDLGTVALLYVLGFIKSDLCFIRVSAWLARAHCESAFTKTRVRGG